MAALLGLAGCHGADDGGHADHDGGNLATSSAGARPAGGAVAVVKPTAGNSCFGVIRFRQINGQVRVVADISGLSPGAEHAIHIHQKGDCSSGDGKSAGGHYNPRGHPHGLPDQHVRHAGDLGNLLADGSGVSHYEIVVDNISIEGRLNPILGRSVIVHAKRDTGEQPTGGAGPRIGCGAIGISD